MFLIGRKPRHSWLLRMFRLVQEALGSSQTVLPGSLGQELSSPYHIRLPTTVFMNHTSNSGPVNIQLAGECLHLLPMILIDRTDDLRRPDNDRSPTMSFSVRNADHITSGSLLFAP